MAVEGGNKIIKYLMFFFNFIFFVCGIVIIVGGALVFTKYNDYVDFTGSMGNAIPILLLVVGVFILFTGFVGCCGALRENYCMICTFAIVMVILLVVELSAGIAGYVLRDEIEDTIGRNMNRLMANYTSIESTHDLFDRMQEELECCGTNKSSDWFPYLGADTVPESCCKNETSTCGTDFKPSDIYSLGCKKALFKVLDDNIIVIAAIAIAVALVQIFGVVCSCCLMRSIKSEYEVV